MTTNEQYVVRMLEALREDQRQGFDRMEEHFERLNGRVRKAESTIAVHEDRFETNERVAQRAELNAVKAQSSATTMKWVGSGGLLTALAASIPHLKELIAELFK